MSVFVLDASVTVALFLPDESHPIADLTLHRLDVDEALALVG